MKACIVPLGKLDFFTKMFSAEKWQVLNLFQGWGHNDLSTPVTYDLRTSTKPAFKLLKPLPALGCCQSFHRKVGKAASCPNLSRRRDCDEGGRAARVEKHFLEVQQIIAFAVT